MERPTNEDGIEGVAKLIAVMVFGLLVTACGAPAPTSSVRLSPSPSPTTPLAKGEALGRPGCQPPSHIGMWQSGWPEIRGTIKGGELWALGDGLELPATPGVQYKIIWRMTGTGTFTLTARGPGGQTLNPDWGPEAHGGSNWNRPGNEWGVGFTFPVAGCWDLHATRQGLNGDVYIEVA